MQARIQKWGNSLAVRIPKIFATQSHLRQDSLVEISEENGRIILFPVPQPEITLGEMLNNITPENIHGEISTNSAIGKEIW